MHMQHGITTLNRGLCHTCTHMRSSGRCASLQAMQLPAQTMTEYLTRGPHTKRNLQRLKQHEANGKFGRVGVTHSLNRLNWLNWLKARRCYIDSLARDRCQLYGHAPRLAKSAMRLDDISLPGRKHIAQIVVSEFSVPVARAFVERPDRASRP